MTILVKASVVLAAALASSFPTDSHAYVLAPFGHQEYVFQCPNVNVESATVTPDGNDRSYRMSVFCEVKRDISGPPWQWTTASLVGEVRATYSKTSRRAVWLADYSAQSSIGHRSGRITLVYDCAVDPYFDDGVASQCVLTSMSDTGDLLTHVDQRPPASDSVQPAQLVTQATEPPPPPPDTKNPLAEAIQKTGGANPVLFSQRVRVLSPGENEVVAGDTVLFRLVEASLKHANGDWRFGESECCVFELQYKAYADKALSIPVRWITVAERNHLDHGQTLADGKNRDRDKLAEWAVEALQGTVFTNPNTLEMLEGGNKARGEWRWRARVVRRDGEAFDSLWREFRIVDVQQAQEPARRDSSQPARE